MDVPSEPTEPVVDPACWLGPELQDSTDWQVRLNEADIAELEQALGDIRRAGLSIIEVRRRDVVLPTLGPKLAALRREILDGRGFVLLRGLPVERHDAHDAALLYWMIGCHFVGSPGTELEFAL